MARTTKWRQGEEHVITVTPVSRGLFLPALICVVATALTWFGASHVHFVHTIRVALFCVLVLPGLFVFATRAWRWRSQKIHVTNQRVISEHGALRHTRDEVELRDVVTTHVGQHLKQRVFRRGVVALETQRGTLSLGVVRHPGALARLIDQERSQDNEAEIAFDTVFDYEAPQDHNFVMNPRKREWRHR
jgi:membrane protein YdbS with pleckstrin-like domain